MLLQVPQNTLFINVSYYMFLLNDILGDRTVMTLRSITHTLILNGRSVDGFVCERESTCANSTAVSIHII